MLEVVNPFLGLPRGRFYHTGDHRFGKGYELIKDDKTHAKAREQFDKILEKRPPLMKDNPFWKTTKGKKFLDAFLLDPKYPGKHLHNHKDYQFYEE